ncbi:MAG: hypothetical protein CMM29_10990 [Rhodospirillaceae bacterium]|nr:hypothetical protein [Rhodospirillaceae bacterium]|tara:strand:+ start:69 stop:782 length:714 start_codon:yes stop_codon:yes gene_type:complete
MSETNLSYVVEDHDEIWSRRVCPSCHKFNPESVEVTDYSGPKATRFGEVEMANFEYHCVGCSVVWTWAEGAPVGNGPDRPPHLDECQICDDWDCFGDCEEREQEELDILAYGEEFGRNHPGYANLSSQDFVKNFNGWHWKEGRKYPGGDGTVWFSEGAPMRVWELQSLLSRLNPTDHVIIAAPSDSRNDWLNVGCVVAPSSPDKENISGVTLFPGQEWNSFDMAVDWDERPERGVFR